MAGYTKLFSSILASTIWREDDKTRIVWITLLAMADRWGIAEGSIPGLADMARVSLDDCKKALEALMSPDEYSRTKENEGRRIEEIEGGWRILNHGKYREKMSADERREYNRKRQAEWRASHKVVTKCQSPSISVTEVAHTEAEAYPKAEAEATTPSSLPPASESGFEEFWQAYPRRVGKADAIKAWKKHKCAAITPKILTSIRALKISPDWTREAGQFIPHPATWLNREGWHDELPEVTNGNHRKESDFGF